MVTRESMQAQLGEIYNEADRLRAALDEYGGPRCPVCQGGLGGIDALWPRERCLLAGGHAGEHLYASDRVAPAGRREVGPIFVYIAGPITVGCQFTNVGNAIRVWHQLRDWGFYPICPHLSGFSQVMRTRSFEDWLDYDTPFVLMSHSLLRLPGESKGADREMRIAQSAGIPLFGAPEMLRLHWQRRAPQRLRNMQALLEAPVH